MKFQSIYGNTGQFKGGATMDCGCYVPGTEANTSFLAKMCDEDIKDI